MGLELEGVYKYSRFNKLYDNYSHVIDFGEDNTAMAPNPPALPDGDHWLHGREMRFHSTINEALDFMEKLYPDLVGPTCGGHVHFSFTTNYDYYKLMMPEFWNYFNFRMGELIQSLKEPYNKMLADRMAGHSKHACRVFIPDMQVFPVGEDGGVAKFYDDLHGSRYPRYAMLNFCWKEHKTLEVRVLPMFGDAKIQKIAILHLVDIIETFCKNFKLPKSEPLTRAIMVNPSCLRRHTITCV